MPTQSDMPQSFDNPECVMRHALSLAKRGLGMVEPNPAVGAVVVDDDLRLLGEGYHQTFGGPHAEVQALKDAGDATRGQTLFVTLEPCCHEGKTPPCTEAVIAAGIKRIVIATGDPTRHANGDGIANLQEAGLQVETGLLEDDARSLIAPFTKLATTGRPFVHAKWAMSLDGRIATRSGDSKWISGEESRKLVHELRGHMDAILVGIGTAVTDNPRLTTRPPGARIATRVIVDSKARLPLDSQLVQTVSDAPVLVISGPQAPTEKIDALREAGVEVLVLAEEAEGRPSLKTVMNELGSRRMTNVLVEGGAAVFGSLFDQRLVDMAHVFVGPRVIGGNEAWSAVGGRGCETLAEAFSVIESEVQTIGPDVYIRGRLPQ